MDIPNVLKEIVEVKKREVDLLKIAMPLAQLEQRIQMQKPALNLAGALMGESVSVVAEVKKASPTAGLLTDNFDPGSLALAYADNGAAAISVLTNEAHFQGSIYDLVTVHEAVKSAGTPVLRKEFIFDSYQVYEARAYGADAILLIVSILTLDHLKDLMELAQRFWMQCLVEVHNFEELRVALDAGAEIVGINNRDLRTFKTGLEVTEQLAPLIPADKIIVSESGISCREHVLRLGKVGVHAVLVGEALVASADPGAKLRSLQ